MPMVGFLTVTTCRQTAIPVPARQLKVCTAGGEAYTADARAMGRTGVSEALDDDPTPAGGPPKPSPYARLSDTRFACPWTEPVRPVNAAG